ncbi:TonB-dependent receptor [Rapidithrix thailandica]|uniref:TonB-dependent receptor n=1 Tax=Rapidithrix thailandica TaxID=413964 RepID=A0AAW9S765_9BACT
MKRTLLLSFLVLSYACIGQAMAEGLDKAKNIEKIFISLSLQNATLQKAFEEIDERTGLKFVYNSNLVPVGKRVSLRVEEQSVKYVLTEIAKAVRVNFKQIDNTILVKPGKEPSTIKDESIEEEGQGIVRGRVVDENGLSLPGAHIKIVELEQNATIADENGKFILLNVPSGKYQLQITYIGYESGTENITIETGNTVDLTISLAPNVMVGEEVLVLGDRLKGQAKALNQQKNNPNITNVVSADQIGRFPDANIGDAMKRIPGITVQNDQGEARDFIIRGLAPQLNSVTLNGERVPSAEGDNRKVQLDLIPADMVQTIEVNKALTPDMDADAIGGSVNLVTRSAPEGFRVSGTLGSGYSFFSEKPIWTGGLVLGNRFFNNKLGAILSASYNHHDFGSDNMEAAWMDTEEHGAIIEEYDVRTYFVKRVRRSMSLNLDYRFSPNHTLYLSGMYNWRDDWENRYRFRVGKLDEAYEEGDFSVIEPGLYETLGRIGRQTKGGSGNDRINNSRLEDQRIANISLRGDHLFGILKVDWALNYAKASEERPHERYISYRSGGLPVRMDLRNPKKPLVTPLQENQWQSLEINEISEQYGYTEEEDLNARLDLRLPLGKGGIVKFGGKYRSKEKYRDNNFFEYSPLDEGTFGELLNDVPHQDQTKGDFLVGDQYNAGYFVDKGFLGGLDLGNTSVFEKEDKPGEYIDGNYQAEESIYAGYLMADYQLGKKFYVLAGLRVEHTDLNYKGFSFDEESEKVGTTKGEDNYTNVLPYLHLKFNASENTVIRAAITKTLARPDYYRLVPYQGYNPEDEELVEGNPNLKPSVSTNLDLMAENYFQSIGLVSVGGFYKKIDDFVYERVMNNFDHPKYGNVDYTTFLNGESVDVYGFEVGVQRQLNFLPGALRGLGIYLNYTNTHSKTSGIQGREESKLSLPGTAKHMFNGSLSFENKKWVMRLSLNYASDYIDELGGSSFDDRYYDKQTFLDFNASYALTPNWRIFAEVLNITNQPLRYYQGVNNRTMQEEFYNMRMNIGVKFDLFKSK